MSDIKSRTIALVGTAIFMLLLFLLLWFVYINPPYLPEDEGIELSFGDDVNGGSSFAEQLPAASVPVTSAPEPVPAEPSPNDMLTQEEEEALALERQRKEEEKRQQQAAEAERIRKQKEEEARKEAERIAKEKALAEQKAKEQQAIDNANRLGGLFTGNQQESGGSGQTSGSTTQGSPQGNPAAGQGTSNGNRWSLGGRRLKSNLNKPQYTGNQEGVIVVSIRVDANGKVIEATVGAGTTISDESMRKAACAEARKAVFSEGPDRQQGTITYYYKLK